MYGAVSAKPETVQYGRESRRENPAKGTLYGQTRSNPYTAPKKQFEVKSGSLDYGVGDRVIHSRFGGGVVKEITQGGRDFEVTVEFDGAGRKKMFASFANLKKEE